MRIETVVINCSTREQSTLALVSALRHARLPVNVVDCESTDGSRAFFERLQSRLRFTLTPMPLRRHGDTLDRLFAATDCEALLLLDSDAEILGADLVPAMIAALEDGAYGSGFLHAGQWLGADHGVPPGTGYYAPRMWIPCVMLKTAPIRSALEGGASFRERIVGNELAQWPWLANVLCTRFRIPLLRNVGRDVMRSRRRLCFGERPGYVHYDTGAALHEALTAAQRFRFAHLGDELWRNAVRHYHGVTRRRLKPGMRNAADADTTRAEAVARIETEYGVPVPELRIR